MIAIGDTLVSEDVIEEHFVCDLAKCKGACCIEGDAGAPLELEEIDAINKNYEGIKSYLSEAGIEAIENYGIFGRDDDEDYVTTLVGGDKECAFTVFENGVASCGIEKAYNDGNSSFRKPISCHLYPVRLSKLKGFTAVNYDRWSICSAACKLGENLKVPVYKFLKDALLKRFGDAWYSELENVAKHLKKQ